MVNPKVDEKAMMTYLSQFPNAKLKAGAPLRPKTNPTRVRAYGPGKCSNIQHCFVKNEKFFYERDTF